MNGRCCRPVQESCAVAEKLRDAAVNFDTYRNLQQHHAVFPATARLLFVIGSGCLLSGSGTDKEKDFASQNILPSNVAGLLKKFLRELPDSVIPEQSYQTFIDAASKCILCDF